LIQRRHIALLFVLLMLTVLSFLISFSSGSSSLGLSEVLQQFFNPEPGLEQQILYELRIPRSIAAFVTGAMLAMSGVVMQVLLRNPLADPYILGISGGSAVAALSAILLGFSGLWISNAAFLGALVSISIVFGLAHGSHNWTATRLLLTGVVLSAGWGAIINVLLTTSANNSVYSMLFWLMGDLSQSRAGTYTITFLVLAFLVLMYFSRALNVLSRGDMQAAALGVDVPKMRLILYFTASVLTACAVSIAGTIGFVGLVIPHMLRLLGARDHRLLVPSALLLGGSFLMIADSFARTIIAPTQLPVGVVTAIIGVPVFLIILRHSSKQLRD